MRILIILMEITVAILVYKLIIYRLMNKTDMKSIAIIKKNDFLDKIISRKMFEKTKYNFIKLNIPFNVVSLTICLVIGLIVNNLIYFAALGLFKIKSVAFIISFPFIFVLFFIINYLADRRQKQLEEVMNDFFIQLKGTLNVNNDCIEAFRRIQNTILEPFRTYVIHMLKEINSGVIPEEALLKFSKKVGIKKFSFYINNLRYANIYGGDTVKLTNESQRLFADILKQKRKREKETNSICIVLYILILIDLFIYFNFIMGSLEYVNLMRSNNIGNLLINLNFLSIWLVFFIVQKIKKLEF